MKNTYIAIKVQQQVLDLKKERPHTPARKIADIVDISRSSVTDILRRGIAIEPIGRNEFVSKVPSKEPKRVPTYTCLGCGYKVWLMPCMICRIQKS